MAAGSFYREDERAERSSVNGALGPTIGLARRFF
jgi:hypothetical protein